MIKNLGKGRLRHTLTLPQRGHGTDQVAGHDIGRLFLAIGQAVYEFESEIKKAPRNALEIAAPQTFLDSSNVEAVSNSLERLISFVLLADVTVSFVPFSDGYQNAAVGLSREVDAVALFSGGVDSVSATLIASLTFQKIVSVFCSHLYQGRVIGITRRLGETYLRRYGIDLYELPAPSMDTTGYSQTRGLLYILTAAAVATWLKASNIIVGECGPTMYQPKFGPADQTTMTTHPFLIDRAKDIIDAFAPGLAISTPFENLTKAEVMAICPKPRAFLKSHSCISQRLELHDGTCYGCIVRRLAALASSSPDVQYANDPITSDSATSGNLLSLLSFCVDFLSSPRALPSYQKDLIFGYRKRDLFERFSLDNFAALHRLIEQKKALAPAVNRAYQDAIDALGGVQPLERRLQTLNRMKQSPPKIPF